MEKPKRSGPKVFGPEYVTHAVEIEGRVNQPQRLCADELRAMELTEVRDLTMICGSGRNEGHIESYRGVPLCTLLRRADVIMRDHDSPNWTYVTLHSSDGHWEIFSYVELFNTVVGEQAIVIVERDGGPLGEEEGEIAFVSANDRRLGPRKLRYLQRIVVHEHSPLREVVPGVPAAPQSTAGEGTAPQRSMPILDEAGQRLRELYGGELDRVTVERLVVGVFFTGVKLSNGYAGVAYTPPELIERASTRILKGRPATYQGVPAARLIDADMGDPFAPVIRLAALNALSARFFGAGEYCLAEHSELNMFPHLFRGRRVCMVGAIIPLLKSLAGLGAAAIDIVDRKKATQAELQWGEFIPVERTAEVLGRCQTAILTGASVANGTIEQLLGWTAPDAVVAVVGPTGSMIPDPLFRRRVAMVATVVITDADRALDILAEGGGGYQLFRDCVRKICLVNPERMADISCSFTGQ